MRGGGERVEVKGRLQERRRKGKEEKREEGGKVSGDGVTSYHNKPKVQPFQCSKTSVPLSSFMILIFVWILFI